jgi:16S rRNA (uracil1498-N3)-methyltransferase
VPRLYVSPDLLRGERAILDESAHRHLIKVLRLTSGARVQLFDGTGVEIDARIEGIGRASVELVLGERRQCPTPACTITLLQSLPKGERMDLIVQKTTELGVARIVPVVSEHAMVKPPAGRTQRWQTIAQEAARQCGRADVPTIAPPTPLATSLAELPADVVARFVLFEGERARSFRSALADGPRRLVLLVGPEGGFAEAEVRRASDYGFVAVSMGPRILRSETAAIAGVTLAQAAAGGLD